MSKYILRISLALFCVSSFALSAAAQEKAGLADSAPAAVAPFTMQSSAPTAMVSNLPGQMEAPNFDEIAITVRGNQLRVQHAEGLNLMVYNITGVKVSTHRVESDDFTLTLNVERGIYIVKVGKVVRRITIG